MVIEQDCEEDPLFLFVPLQLQLDVGEGGVNGVLDGDLKVSPDGTLFIRAEGEVQAAESWASVAEAHVQDQQVKGTLSSWRATAKGLWEQASVRLDAVNLDEAGEDWVTSLWDGSWVLTDTELP